MDKVQLSAKSALIVEDNRLFREVISLFMMDMGYQVSTASTLDEALMSIVNAEEPFTVALVDIAIPKDKSDKNQGRSLPNGMEVVHYIKKRSPNTGVVIWTIHADYLNQALLLVRQGYSGIIAISKTAEDPESQLEEAINESLRGYFYTHPDTLGSSPEEIFLSALPANMVSIIQDVSELLDTLSLQEWEVAKRISIRPEIIASEMNLAVKTVRNYIQHIYDKISAFDENCEFGLRSGDIYQKEVVLMFAIVLRRMKYSGKGRGV